MYPLELIPRYTYLGEKGVMPIRSPISQIPISHPASPLCPVTCFLISHFPISHIPTSHALRHLAVSAFLLITSPPPHFQPPTQTAGRGRCSFQRGEGARPPSSLTPLPSDIFLIPSTYSLSHPPSQGGVRDMGEYIG